MTLVYVYGSGECEQLGLGDDILERKTPKKLQIFELGAPGLPPKSIIKVSCGGMHTLALASNGVVYAWGTNDDGALGRFGPENVPMRVDGALDIPVTDLATGDCHSVAYNSELNQVFFWGRYKDVVDGKASPKMEIPTRIGEDLFNDTSKARIKKIVSGAQHTVALTEGKQIYTWGDARSGKLGRPLRTVTRRQKSSRTEIETKTNLVLKLEKIGAKNAVDIFCGKFHSFYVNEARQVFAWGMNNHGQLGIGNKVSKATPVRVKDLDPYEGDHFVQIVGGEHHTVARMKSGCVYCFGRNDEGQMGLGDLFGAYKREQRAKQVEPQ